MHSALIGSASALVAALVVSAWAWAAYLGARALLPGASASSRWAGAAVLFYGILYAVSSILSIVGVFGSFGGILVTALLVAAAHSVWGGSEACVDLSHDLSRVRAVLLAASTTPWALAGSAVAGLALVRVVRATALPPLGWDALSYHLFRAGRLVQRGAVEVLAAPDSWGYYERFPTGGTRLFAWALLPAKDGAFLGAAGGLVLAILALGGYAAARRWGASEARALGAASALAGVPAVAVAATASYVDNTAMALFVLALPFSGLGQDGRPRTALGEAALCGVALSLASATKASLLPTLVCGAILLAARALLVRERPRLGRLAAFAVPAAAVFLAEFGGTWWETGSPLFPVPLRVAGIEIAAGNEELGLVLSGRIGGAPAPQPPVLETLRWMFAPWRLARTDYTGLGPGAALLSALGIAGTVVLLRDRHRRSLPIVALVGAAAIVVGAWSPETVALRSEWGSVFARHLLPAWAFLAVAASVPATRLAGPVWGVGLSLSFLLSLPRGWTGPDVRATVTLVPWILAGLLAAALMFAAPALRSRRVLAGGVALLLAVVPATAAIERLRPAARYTTWAATSRRDGPFDYVALSADRMAAWPVWKRLDEGSPVRIAVAAGWNGIGQVWYLYPLLGSRLQNVVTYVSPTSDGSVIDYRDADSLAAAASFDAWLGRLMDRGIDVVVTTAPSPPERLGWIVANPDLFVEEEGDAAHDVYLYRLDRRRAAARRTGS